MTTTRKQARPIKVLVLCNGEAHGNPYIDNCMVCMPRWEWVQVTWEGVRTSGTCRVLRSDGAGMFLCGDKLPPAETMSYGIDRATKDGRCIRCSQHENRGSKIVRLDEYHAARRVAEGVKA